MGEFTVPLLVTSPLTRGSRVRDCQWVLSGHNRFSGFNSPISTYKDAMDGVYGVHTSSAALRAKFWLGYPEDLLTGSFTQVEFEYLTGTKIPPEYLATREKRVLRDKLPNKLLYTAKTQIGINESPRNSNMQKYGQWYGYNGVPWCAIFISWCMNQIGKKWRYAYVPFVVNDALAGKGMHIVHDPKPGDLVAYNWVGQKDAHIAIFDSWIDGYDFWDVGGNTGRTDLANGGEVLRQSRNITLVDHFIRIW